MGKGQTRRRDRSSLTQLAKGEKDRLVQCILAIYDEQAQFTIPPPLLRSIVKEFGMKKEQTRRDHSRLTSSKGEKDRLLQSILAI